MKIRKSIKFHTQENKGKTEELQAFLQECLDISNHLISMNHGCFIETNKFEFIHNTKDFNIFYKIRSHHYQQIQCTVFTKIRNHYDSVLKNLNFKHKYLNYLKYFMFSFDEVERYLKNKSPFHQEVLEYWNENEVQIRMN
jgi:hypothetical protein